MDANAVFDDFRDDIREAILQRLESLAGGSSRLSLDQIEELTNGLHRVTEGQLTELGQQDSICAICLTPFLALLSEEEVAVAMDSPAHPLEELGVARLSKDWQCGHLFCRRDISRWIRESHDSCPTCRRALLERSSTSGSTAPTPFPTREVPPVNVQNLPQELREAISHLNEQFPGVFSDVFQTGGTEAVAETPVQPRPADMHLLSPVDLSELSAFMQFGASHGSRARPRDDDRNEYAGMYS
ncbi:hypothetical protein CYLTODRAFT_416787 [Cylindrobasidium torrendii FP15055 ss-10]|uniref:RING-type domain-containing protein n=1 Tax=Cylindrobasidium torrendii FP15055 ss-10 TaxID=1314674 RepID=A0A0D7BVY0_9AGAR|nr:hypothetical protein CYLTODRAFT_416787 [Cylindrobasidium torrendii FP15055 ss-10]